MESLTIQQIAQRKSERLNLGLEFCNKLVSNLSEVFAVVKDGQVMLCEKCQKNYALDGRYNYHGKQTCEKCGSVDLCSMITPDYGLVQ